MKSTFSAAALFLCLIITDLSLKTQADVECLTDDDFNECEEQDPCENRCLVEKCGAMKDEEGAVDLEKILIMRKSCNAPEVTEEQNKCMVERACECKKDKCESYDDLFDCVPPS